MADLNVTIGADISAYQAGMSKAGQIAATTSSEITKDLANAANASNNLGGAAMTASMKFQQMRSGISAARDGLMGFTIGGQAGDRMLMAMGHHINSLVNETGSFTGAMKAMGSALLGPGGIILGLTAAFELFQHFSKSESDAYDATKNFTSAADAQHSVFQNLDGSYSEAVKDVNELTENVKLAKEGFISKSEVVKEYNDTLGKTMGAVKTLDEVEKKLVEGAQDYIKMMLYKAAAQTALKEASDKAVEAAKVQMKSQEELQSIGSKIASFSVGQQSGPGLVPGSDPINASKQRAETLKAFADKARKEEVDKYQADSDKLLKIADEFQTKAATISSSHKWNFLPDMEEKVKKAKEGFAIIEAEIEKVTKEMETALMNNAPPTVLNAFERQLVGLNAKLDALKQKMLLVFFPHINDVLPTDNKTTQNSVSGILGTPSTMSGDDMAKGATHWKEEHELIWRSINDWKSYKAELKADKQTLQEITSIIGGGLMNAFQTAMSGTQSFVQAMGNFLLQLIEKLVAAAAAAAVLAVLLSATGFGAAMGASASFGSLFSTLSGFKGLAAHAEGGIFTQPHVGMFGEAGPEAIVTPKHLADFAGVAQGGGGDQTLTMKLQGSDMLLFLNRANKTKSRTS